MCVICARPKLVAALTAHLLHHADASSCLAIVLLQQLRTLGATPATPPPSPPRGREWPRRSIPWPSYLTILWPSIPADTVGKARPGRCRRKSQPSSTSMSALRHASSLCGRRFAACGGGGEGLTVVTQSSWPRSCSGWRRRRSGHDRVVSP